MQALPADIRSKMEELTKAAVKELPSYDMDLAQRMMEENIDIDPNSFCSYGDRKEGADNG